MRFLAVSPAVAALVPSAASAFAFHDPKSAKIDTTNMSATASGDKATQEVSMDDFT